jgi:dTDP-4-dehydrorhamnose 3,5-epimerase-like enzyme
MNNLIQIRSVGNGENGYLAFFESQQDITFVVKRIYYIYKVPINAKRGMHAHKKLKQIFWCPYGKIEVILDDGEQKRSYLLDEPEKALILSKCYWRDIYWRKKGSVLCVAASDYYDEADYIRDYNEFLKFTKEGH